MYKHLDITLLPINLPVGKVVCVGQNYADHILEMNSTPDVDDALLFMKPSTALTPLMPKFAVPEQKLGPCHNETELAVLIKQPLTKACIDEIDAAIWGYGIALDLTLREVQARAKKMGRPWERAKSFDGSCPTSPFIEKAQFVDPQACQISLIVNEKVRQKGNTGQMLRSINNLLVEISHCFTLLLGDIVLTGTPAGVGPLIKGDKLTVNLASTYQFETEVV
ncbi:fumarylacetoacetate hydrolase family protein [Algibacillus agarilyticus]|uniref:fumarylacetoacetate hydrolase family protein n=1 Tax=Algibacillus agarilyticus TaxID=2234133 RepID=UPI000DCFDEE7|nr:fumarylacetoacetate hydrolase family protein [Algibacillus agarilyticus]